MLLGGGSGGQDAAISWLAGARIEKPPLRMNLMHKGADEEEKGTAVQIERGEGHFNPSPNASPSSLCFYLRFWVQIEVTSELLGGEQPAGRGRLTDSAVIFFKGRREKNGTEVGSIYLLTCLFGFLPLLQPSRPRASAVCHTQRSFTNSFSVSVRAQMSLTIAALGLTLLAHLHCDSIATAARSASRAAAWACRSPTR